MFIININIIIFKINLNIIMFANLPLLWRHVHSLLLVANPRDTLHPTAVVYPKPLVRGTSRYRQYLVATYHSRKPSSYRSNPSPDNTRRPRTSEHHFITRLWLAGDEAPQEKCQIRT